MRIKLLDVDPNNEVRYIAIAEDIRRPGGGAGEGEVLSVEPILRKTLAFSVSGAKNLLGRCNLTRKPRQILVRSLGCSRAE